MLEPPVAARADHSTTPPDPLIHRAIGIAGITGVVYATLVHDVGPGLGWSLLFLSFVGSLIWMVSRQADRQTLLLLGAAAVPAALLAVRELPALVALNVVAFVSLVSIAMGLRRRPGLHRWTVSTLLEELTVNTLGPLVEAPRYLKAGLPEAGDTTRAVRHRGGSIIIGLGLSAVLVLVFGGLLVSADAVFEGWAERLFQWTGELAELAGRLLSAAVVAWLALGAIARFRQPRLPRAATAVEMKLQAPVVLMPLLTMNVMFSVFVAIQFAYLFGGADTVARTRLTYAEYARRGFFELVAVAALIVGVILLADWASRHLTRRRPIVAASQMLIALTLAIGTAAVRRMLLYVDEFGLSQLRVYTTTFLIWVGFVLIWLAFTVLRGKRGRFVIGTVASAFVLTVGLNLAHPAALIANVNLDRSVAGNDLDVGYLVDLGPGAVPTLEARVASVPDPIDRALLQGRLAQPRGESDWRSLTLDDLAARTGS
ncbi:MAG: DUF4173 domain-containing protein [Acidimicrobiia bacterium]|nr:DUF4173 domain-containing protein [Acidimicrobiia bacterium]